MSKGKFEVYRSSMVVVLSSPHLGLFAGAALRKEAFVVSNAHFSVCQAAKIA